VACQVLWQKVCHLLAPCNSMLNGEQYFFFFGKITAHGEKLKL